MLWRICCSRLITASRAGCANAATASVKALTDKPTVRRAIPAICPPEAPSQDYTRRRARSRGAGVPERAESCETYWARSVNDMRKSVIAPFGIAALLLGGWYVANRPENVARVLDRES